MVRMVAGGARGIQSQMFANDFSLLGSEIAGKKTQHHLIYNCLVANLYGN